jgi:hypothetical protein
MALRQTKKYKVLPLVAKLLAKLLAEQYAEQSLSYF